jgi:hypothetical protein
VEREIWEPFLRRVERRVAIEERGVDEQVRQICELQRRGQDAKQARKWLGQLEDQLNRDIAHRNRMKRFLKGS